MTRKHFEGLAQLVRLWTQDIEAGIPTGPSVIASDLARFCQSHNRRFDYERFMLACKPTKEGK